MPRRIDLVIKGGTIVSEDQEITGSLAIDQGVVLDVIEGNGKCPLAFETVDADGLYVMPGVVDAHCHFGEPGRVNREGFESGTRAAAAGGVTTVFDHPNTTPPVSDLRSFFDKRAIAESKCVVDFALWGAVLPGNSHMADLSGVGAIGFKAFMTSVNPEYPRVTDADLYEAMEAASALHTILAVHAESHEMIIHDAVDSDDADWRAVVRARPPESELDAVRRAIRISEETGAALHIVHASLAEVGRLAGASPADISVETCPHYLCFDESEFERQGALVKTKPPLRTATTREDLWRSLKRGEIQMVASDHAPYLLSEKTEVSLWNAPWGIPTIEYSLLTLLSEGVMRRDWSLSEVVRVLSSMPARRFGIFGKKGILREGADADVVLVNLEQHTLISQDSIQTRCGWSPWLGQTFIGRVLMTMVRGRPVYLDGAVIGNAGYGELVRPLRS